jgi:hypothetical protein
MNTITARRIAAQIAELVELASIFQARYGKDYRLKPGSPADAWDMHRAIFDKQSDIARLLDIEALEQPLKRLPDWWKYRDTVDTGMATQLSQAAAHLIACCAAFEASPRADSSPVVATSQSVIAGMLHPSAVLVGMDGTGRVQMAS